MCALAVLKSSTLRSVIIESGTETERNETIVLMQQAGLEVKFGLSRNWGQTYSIFERG